jgi:hypothetical protein
LTRRTAHSSACWLLLRRIPGASLVGEPDFLPPTTPSSHLLAQRPAGDHPKAMSSWPPRTPGLRRWLVRIGVHQGFPSRAGSCRARGTGRYRVPMSLSAGGCHGRREPRQKELAEQRSARRARHGCGGRTTVADRAACSSSAAYTPARRAIEGLCVPPYAADPRPERRSDDGQMIFTGSDESGNNALTWEFAWSYGDSNPGPLACHATKTSQAVR